MYIRSWQGLCSRNYFELFSQLSITHGSKVYIQGLSADIFYHSLLHSQSQFEQTNTKQTSYVHYYQNLDQHYLNHIIFVKKDKIKLKFFNLTFDNLKNKVKKIAKLIKPHWHADLIILTNQDNSNFAASMQYYFCQQMSHRSNTNYLCPNIIKYNYPVSLLLITALNLKNKINLIMNFNKKGSLQLWVLST